MATIGYKFWATACARTLAGVVNKAATRSANWVQRKYILLRCGRQNAQGPKTAQGRKVFDGLSRTLLRSAWYRVGLIMREIRSGYTGATLGIRKNERFGPVTDSNGRAPEDHRSSL